jgi:hypothetical protein
MQKSISTKDSSKNIADVDELVARAKEMTSEFIYLCYAYPRSDVRFTLYSLM